MAANRSTRLTTTARAVARLWEAGQITLDQLRQQMREAIARAHTEAALQAMRPLSEQGAVGLQEIISGEWQELDRLIDLMQRDDVTGIEQRLTAFADAIDDTVEEVERLQGGISPLVPAAVGGAIGALLARAGQGQARTRLPRIDNRQLGALRDLLGERLDLLADDLAAGRMSADDWHAAMQREVEIIHRTYAELVGGQVSPSRVQAQQTFLDGFRADVEGMSPEAIKRRARMYLDNGQSSLQEALTARIGLPPMPAYPKDGTTICKTGCKCTWEFTQLDGNGNFDCRWVLRPAEHCDTCVRRSAVWNPIEVRNGVLQPYETSGVFA